MSRVGVLGGTFDPVHSGHLEIARHCRDELSLDVVRFMANRRPPHKAPAVASELHRHAMLALATATEPHFVADPRELERTGISYTVETLEEIHAERPADELFFLIGADSLRDLASWHRAGELTSLATFVAVGRRGVDARDALAIWRAAASALGDEAGRPVERERVLLLDHEPAPWSSSELRRLLGVSEAPEGAIPTPVLDYIRKNRLYAESHRRSA